MHITPSVGRQAEAEVSTLQKIPNRSFKASTLSTRHLSQQEPVNRLLTNPGIMGFDLTTEQGLPVLEGWTRTRSYLEGFVAFFCTLILIGC
jgi:hypothetical protein